MCKNCGDFMRRAVACAEKGVEQGGGPFGAVVVKDGRVIFEAHNRVTIDNDPTAHAEIVAIRGACEELNRFDLSGCEIYCSCEPCPMCLAAIYWARIEKIYYAASQMDAENAGFSDAFIYKQFALDPSHREIKSTQIDAVSAKNVFTKWIAFEEKKRY